MRRHRYNDPLEIGRSKVIPYDPSLPWPQRHIDRLSKNILAKREVFYWTTARGYRMRIHNEDHHWIFEGPGFFVEWWPSSAKLVINNVYQRGVHVHDWLQLLLVLEGRAMGKPRKSRRRGPRRPGGNTKRAGASQTSSR